MKILLTLFVLLFSSSVFAEKINIHYSIDVYDRMKIEKIKDQKIIDFAHEHTLSRLHEVINTRGHKAYIGKTTSEISQNTLTSHFHLNFEVIVYPGLNFFEDGEETLIYITSKRCDGDVFHMWSTWTMDKALDIVISGWDDYALSEYENVNILKNCPFKFNSIKSID